MQAVYRLCGELGLPVLIHFWPDQRGGGTFEEFERMLQTYPDTVFIGHAPGWWLNISSETSRTRSPNDLASRPSALPPVIPGGLTDRWLGQYPNLYGDLSARSGMNALTRDSEFAGGFVNRHRHKLLWGTDCSCWDGRGTRGVAESPAECFASTSLRVLKELCDDEETFFDITEGNARTLLRLD